jgi:hypothetical protein
VTFENFCQEPEPGACAQAHFTLLPAKVQTICDEDGDAGPGVVEGMAETSQEEAAAGVGGWDDPQSGAQQAPVLSLLRKKSMSWKPSDQAARNEKSRDLYVASQSLASAPTPLLVPEELMSASSEDEEEKAAIAARKAKQSGFFRSSSPASSGSKPPLAKTTPPDQRPPTGDGAGKEKRKSVFSRNPVKMLNKIRARSRSASREPSPRSGD